VVKNSPTIDAVLTDPGKAAIFDSSGVVAARALDASVNRVAFCSNRFRTSHVNRQESSQFVPSRMMPPCPAESITTARDPTSRNRFYSTGHVSSPDAIALSDSAVGQTLHDAGGFEQCSTVGGR